MRKKVYGLAAILIEAEKKGFDYFDLKTRIPGVKEYFKYEALEESVFYILADRLENAVIFDLDFLETLGISGFYCSNCDSLCQPEVERFDPPAAISQCCKVKVVYLNSKDHPKPFLQTLVVCDEPVLMLARLMGYDNEE